MTHEVQSGDILFTYKKDGEPVIEIIADEVVDGDIKSIVIRKINPETIRSQYISL